MRRTFLIFMFLFGALFIKAQDPTLSQFQYQKLELNPAYGGHAGNGMLHFTSASRTSFYPVRGPFIYSTIALDFSPCKPSNLGIGILVNKEVQGDGYYSKTRIGLNLAYAVALNRKNSLSFGIRPGIIQQAIDWNEFVFSDQLDPLKGISQPSFNQGAPLDLSSTPNWDFGIKWNRYKQGRAKYMFGFSAFNITQPQIGLLSIYRINRRLSLHGSRFGASRTKKYLFKSNFRIDQQGDYFFIGFNQEVIIEKKLGFNFGGTIPSVRNIPVEGGLIYFSFGAQYQFNPSLLIYMSYENNISGKTIVGKTSSFEIGIIIITVKSLCQTNSLKESFNFSGNQKIVTPLGCPKISSDGKIESF